MLTLRAEGWEDAAELRRMLEEELEVSFAEPGREDAASGELWVRFDASARRVTVRYRNVGAPISRDVSTPAGEAEARRAALLLSGSLARGGPPVVTPASPPPVRPLSRDPDASEHRLDALERMLTAHGEPNGARTPLGVGALVLGPGLIVTSYAMKDHDDARLVVGVTGAILAGLGVGLLIPARNPTERARDAVREARARGADRAAVEAALAEKVDDERRMRKFGGGVVMALGTGAVAVGAGYAWSGVPREDRERRGLVAAALAVGAGYALYGLYHFVVPGPIEEVQRQYEAAFPKRAASFAPAFTPLLGGGMAGLSGKF